MIALGEQYQRPRRDRGRKALERRKRQERERCERALRFCVITGEDGRVDLRYFAHPADAEGVTIRLTKREREELCYALAQPGPHFVLRDDAAETPAGGDR